MGKIDLLFKMLAIPINLHQDGYHNNLLHLAIKAQLPTVARFILEYCHFGALDQVDASGDSVLTLAMKAGDEELACSILREGADAGIKGRELDAAAQREGLVHPPGAEAQDGRFGQF